MSQSWNQKGQGIAEKLNRRKRRKSPPYTSYDIWCAGAFAQTFTVINKAEEGVYEQLLKVCNPFPQSHKSALELPEEEALRRSMNPGSMIDVDHWDGFKAVETDEEMDDSEYDYDDVDCRNKIESICSGL